MARIKYEAVTTYTNVKHPYSRTAKFTNQRVAIKHAKDNGQVGVVYDLLANPGVKVKVFSRV